MGSSLSINNDTDHPWWCKIGPDEAALDIVNYILFAISLLTVVVASAAASGVLTGITAKVIASMSAKLGTAAVGRGLTAVAVVILATKESLRKDGYVEILPGTKYTWKGLTLSLWQQGTCQAHLKASEDEMWTKLLYMRPIFSGATDGSELVHDIRYWTTKMYGSTPFLTSQLLWVPEEHESFKPAKSAIYSGTNGQICLSSKGVVTGNGSPLVMAKCSTTTTSQQFTFDAKRRLVHAASGKCVDDSSAQGSRGAKMHLWDCHDGMNQRWLMDKSNQLHVLSNRRMCLDIPGGSTATGTQLQIWDCNGTPAQQWGLASFLAKPISYVATVDGYQNGTAPSNDIDFLPQQHQDSSSHALMLSLVCGGLALVAIAVASVWGYKRRNKRTGRMMGEVYTTKDKTFFAVDGSKTEGVEEGGKDNIFAYYDDSITPQNGAIRTDFQEAKTPTPYAKGML